MRRRQLVLSLSVTLVICAPAWPGIAPGDAVLYLDFTQAASDLSPQRRPLRLNGARWAGRALEFTNSAQFAEADLSRALDGIQAMTVG